jgi:hypothetical protein
MLVEPTFDDLQRLYRQAIAETVRIPIEEFDRPQTLVVGETERSGSAMAVAYHLGETTVVRCDPDLVASLDPLVDTTRGLDSETFWARAEGLGLRYVNGGDQRVVPMAELVDPPHADGEHLRVVDPDSPADRQSVVDRLDSCDPEDVDAADYEPGQYDPRIIGLCDDATGRLLVLASSRPWTDQSPFDDIGVLAADSHRGRGLGRCAVKALCDLMVTADRLPLYRNNWDRPASAALARSLGFRLVAQLTAVGRIQPTTSDV